jgi:hypothetical protein
VRHSAERMESGLCLREPRAGRQFSGAVDGWVDAEQVEEYRAAMSVPTFPAEYHWPHQHRAGSNRESLPADQSHS